MEATEHLKQAAEAAKAAVQQWFSEQHRTSDQCKLLMVCAAYSSSETLRTPVENMNNTFVEFFWA